MGIFSGWEEEYDREEYAKAEGRMLRESMAMDDNIPDVSRPCSPGNQCGSCPSCCTEEQGYKP